VLGTLLQLVVTPESSLLSVQTGQVAFATATQQEIVSAGESARVQDGVLRKVVEPPAPAAAAGSADQQARAEDWLKPLPSNAELAATTLEDGEIIFRDDFTNGLANWEVLRLNPATKQVEPLPEAMKDSVKVVSAKRGDKEIKAVRVDETNEMVVLVLRQPLREQWFAVEFEDHVINSAANARWCSVGIMGMIGREVLTPLTGKARAFSQEEKKTQWWRNRWEFCCGKDPQGRLAVDLIRGLGFRENRGRVRVSLSDGDVRLMIDPGTKCLASRMVIRRLVPKAPADGAL
jgi:hypothetical protein